MHVLWLEKTRPGYYWPTVKFIGKVRIMIKTRLGRSKEVAQFQGLVSASIMVVFSHVTAICIEHCGHSFWEDNLPP